MSDFEPTPDDSIVSAVLDGVASADEIQRVADDPRLAARLAQFRAVAAAISGPVPLVDTSVREAHLARALAEGVPAGVSAVSAAPAVAPTPPPPAPMAPPGPPPIDLAAARARRRSQPRMLTILSAAAAVVLIVAAGAFLVRAGDTGGGDAARSNDAALSAPVDDDASSGGADSAGDTTSEFNPNEDTGTAPEDGANSPPDNEVPEAAEANDAAVDPGLPSLGTFTKATQLATRVRGELTLDPDPTDLATGETCRDDFGTPVVLLGRATLGVDEGLVYVEADQVPDRRLWLVAPGAVDLPGGECREITPVQNL